MINMSNIQFLFDVFEKNRSETSVIWKDISYTYDWLLGSISAWKQFLSDHKVTSGDVVSLKGDFSPQSIACMLALMDNSNIIVPFTHSVELSSNRKYEIAGVEKQILIDENDNSTFEVFERKADHEYYKYLRDSKAPGLVLFTSGTSGEPKAAVHNFNLLLEKFKTHRKALRTVNFLLFDHWGGLNTLLHTLSNAGTVLALKDRSPDSVCAFIEKHKIELLPASPTFLNLLLISEAYKRHDLSSLTLITYGTEPMPLSLLERLQKHFPDIKLQQTYGLIELGVLRSKSREDGSLWVKIGGEGFNWRVIENMLQIKADSAMLGYINAPSPFTDDGWFMTGDQVEVDGEWLKILGRKSEIINVGGDKVYPAEVEGIILEVENVSDVTVYGEKNPIMGNIVCAKVTPIHIPENEKEFIASIKKFCKSKLQSFKVPVRIKIIDTNQYNERFKKDRTNVAQND